MVATDKRNKRDGRNNEVLGIYDPLTSPKTIDLKLDRIDYWLGTGASPSETVTKLVDKVRKGEDGKDFITLAKLEERNKARRKDRQAAALDAKPYVAPAPEPAEKPAEKKEEGGEEAAEAAAEETTEAPAEEAAAESTEETAEAADAEKE